MEKLYSSKTLLKKLGGGMHTQHTPHPPGSAPASIITKDGLKFQEKCSKPEISKTVKAGLL